MDENNNQNRPEEAAGGRGDQNFLDGKSLTELFNRTVTLQRRYLHQKLRSYYGDPHQGQGRVLSILNIKPEISQKDLGYLLDMRNQSLSELLIKLERAGYITRTPSEEDRRAMIIRLTEKGRDAAGQAEKGQAGDGLMFGCLSAEEQANLSDYLKRLIISMERGPADDRGLHGADYGYDPFWGVGDAFKDGVRDCCRDYRQEAREQGHALRHQLRRQGREFREELRRQGRDLREELRADPRLKGFFWGAGDWGCGDYESGYDGDDGGGPGNGPRP